jgi:CheY-like chemotaxis protein
MNALMGMSEILAESSLDEEQREDLQIIRNSAEELLSVINILNEFSALESGKTEFYKVWFDHKEKLQTTVNELTRKISNHGNKISLLIKDDVPSRIKADPKKLVGILDHLICSFNMLVRDSSFGVSVTSEYKDVDYIYLSFKVSVSGGGISENTADEVVNFLHKDDPALSEHNGEVAMRLFIAKMLVALMEGELKFFSAQANEPAFSFRINVETEKQHSKKNMTVLVVEDNVLNQQVVITSLRRNGFKYDIAGNGHDAIEKFKKDRFEIILMDIQMPGMDGYETTKRIRELEKAHPTGKTTKIYALTANATSDDYKMGMASGMDGFLTKPFMIDALEKIIRKTPDKK